MKTVEIVVQKLFQLVFRNFYSLRIIIYNFLFAVGPPFSTRFVVKYCIANPDELQEEVTR